MLEPQSTLLFVLLVLIFAALAYWLVVARRLALRIVAGCLAFVVAMFFGVLAVNRYFSYYQTWGAAIADLSNQGVNTGPQESGSSLLQSGATSQQALAHDPYYLQLAEQQGYTVREAVRGKLSHIKRTVYVYFPPQYFQKHYKNYKFPVIELIHGQPGEPQDWINVAGVEVTLDELIGRGLAKPVVLVMPDANGGNDISLQCLNQFRGPQDLTYLALDVPDAISHQFRRLWAPGRGWGIAGYSEGGFCAANMALRYPERYGFAASLSGYFAPMQNQLANPTRAVNPFGHNKQLQAQNTPLDEVRALRAGEFIPQFWLGAGAQDRADVDNASYFAQLLQVHQTDVPVIITKGGGHSMATWRLEIPPMLTWMTEGLTHWALGPHIKPHKTHVAGSKLVAGRTAKPAAAKKNKKKPNQP
jgi:enterochelin esterase-like enzyme